MAWVLRRRIEGGWVPHPHLLDLKHRLNPWYDFPLYIPAVNAGNYWSPVSLGDATVYIDWRQVDRPAGEVLDEMARARGILK
jgi:hypothetical protein